MMKLVATHSFRGGSGKSFVVLNMAALSGRSGIKTCVMDCDFGSPSFQSNLPPAAPPTKYGNDFLLGNSPVEDIVCQTAIPGLDAIYADPEPILDKGLLDPSEGVQWKVFERLSLLRENLAERGYQRLFIDTTPDLTYRSTSALIIADSIVLVHRPVTHSLDLTVYILQTVYAKLKKSMKPRSFFLLYNQVPHGTVEQINAHLDALTAELQKHLEIEVLGNIPLDPAMDFSDSLLLREDSPVLNGLKQMLAKIT